MMSIWTSSIEELFCSGWDGTNNKFRPLENTLEDRRRNRWHAGVTVSKARRKKPANMITRNNVGYFKNW